MVSLFYGAPYTLMEMSNRRIMVVHREVNSKGSEPKKDVMGAYIQHVGPKTIKNPRYIATYTVSYMLVYNAPHIIVGV